MKKYLLFSLFFLVPSLVIAQSAGDDIWSLWEYLFYLIGRLTQIFWILAIMTFLWGLVDFLRQADNVAEQKKAKTLMVGSVVAFTIALSFWGLITFVIDAGQLEVDTNTLTLEPVTSAD